MAVRKFILIMNAAEVCGEWSTVAIHLNPEDYVNRELNFVTYLQLIYMYLFSFQ